MLFKLSLRNIRRSLRDYAIYFFTLIIGVSVFYVFNAIGSQTAMMRMSQSQYDIIEMLVVALSGISVFVAGILGLLIVYASRFLMKRRHKEFALYMMLGMSKGKISAILLIETVIIGISSLAAGLLAGIGISQLMSALVASLFEVDMSTYKFTISSEAIVKTILYFAVMYLVVMIFNSGVVTKMKLIDLMQSGKRSEQIKLKSPGLCVVIFLASVAALGYAYYNVGWNYIALTRNKMLLYIAIGCVSTFFIFWSVSGMLLRVLMKMKKVYHRGLNSFTFRQLSSKVNTMVFSMTLICLMLFVTICTLTSAFTIRNSLNANIKTYCPADAEINISSDLMGDRKDLAELFSDYGYDVDENFKEYVQITVYEDPSFTYRESCGKYLEAVTTENSFINPEYMEDVISLSDYNSIMELFGRETVTLEDNEYILMCNYSSMKDIRDSVLKDNSEMKIFGNTLVSKYDECKNGFISLSTSEDTLGLFVVPDSILEGKDHQRELYLIGNYSSKDIEAADNQLKECFEKIYTDLSPDEEFIYFRLNTRLKIKQDSVGVGALVTFLGLYIGLIFLISCGAILGLKQLSDSTDSIDRYDMLRKIGAEESDISKSLFRQTGLFFLLPLILACIHSVFGMKFSVYVMDFFGTNKIGESIAITSLILLLIYGGYFLITYLCSKNIIKDRK